MSQEATSTFFEYDDNDDRHGEMSTLRARVDEAHAGSAESVSELQTNQMGPAEPLEEAGFIYFIETDDARFIKIGFSVKVIRRMAELGTIMPIRLIGCFPGSMHTERWLHRKFAADHKDGEWFHSTPALRDFIDMLGLMQPMELAEPPAPVRAKLKRAPGDRNPAAVALANLRLEKLTPERRKQIARKGGAASKAKLTPEERSAIARKAGLAGGRGRKK